MRRLALGLALLLVIIVAAPAGADVTQQELADARQKINKISEDLEDELLELDSVLILQYQFEERIAQINRDLADRERQISLAAFAAQDQARAMYVSAGTSRFQAVVSPEGITTLGTKNAYMDAVVDLDVDVVNRLEFLQEDRERLQSEVESLLAQQEDLAGQLEAVSDGILIELTAANDEYQILYQQFLREEEERRRRAAEEQRRREAAAAAAAAAASGNSSSQGTSARGRTCPVAGANTFRDGWLDPRPGGRRHHGVDMVAARGTPLVAVETGTIFSPNWHWAGGIGLYLRGDTGDIYYYAHMNGYGPGIAEGVRVGRGQTVGYVGSTGNSSVPHLHLGYQPGGGPLTNPYQLMVKLCR